MPNGVSWTREQKQDAALQYAINGSLVKTRKATGIPETTLSNWRRNDDEWLELIAEVRSEKTDEHRAQYSKILDLAHKQTIKELPNATAQQASIIGGVAFDKLRLIDNQPTSISSTTGGMKALVDKFNDLADKWDEKQARVVKTIKKDK
jgi:transposase-like protein